MAAWLDGWVHIAVSMAPGCHQQGVSDEACLLCRSLSGQRYPFFAHQLCSVSINMDQTVWKCSSAISIVFFGFPFFPCFQPIWHFSRSTSVWKMVLVQNYPFIWEDDDNPLGIGLPYSQTNPSDLGYPYGGFHQWSHPNSWMVYNVTSYQNMDDLGVPPH